MVGFYDTKKGGSIAETITIDAALFVGLLDRTKLELSCQGVIRRYYFTRLNQSLRRREFLRQGRV